MSLKIGQKTKKDLPILNTDTKMTLTPITEETFITSTASVKDPGYETSSLNKNQNYYLSFQANGLQNNFTITLKGTNKEMPIKYYSTAVRGKCETVFAPNDSGYNKIIFKIQRTGTNFGVENIQVSNVELYSMDSIINKKIKRLGVQAPAGTILCINGEEIRVGKSNTYEVSDIAITNLAVFQTANVQETINELHDYIIIDYLYEEGDNE